MDKAQQLIDTAKRAGIDPAFIDEEAIRALDEQRQEEVRQWVEAEHTAYLKGKNNE
jgi:hypothetical protein